MTSRRRVIVAVVLVVGLVAAADAHLDFEHGVIDCDDNPIQDTNALGVGSSAQYYDSLPEGARTNILIEPVGGVDRQSDDHEWLKNDIDKWARTVSVSIAVWGKGGLCYEDIMLCMYSGNGSLMYSKRLETLQTTDGERFDETYEMNVTLEERPEFIIVDHPKLRDDSPVDSEVLRWQEENPIGEGGVWSDTNYSTMEEVFDFPRHQKAGRCG